MPRRGREIAMAQPWFDEREVVAAAAVVQSGWVTQGACVIEFESAVADLVQAQHAVAVSNCTTALHLGMVAYGIGPGDDVVVPSLSFVATANAVRYVGARPVFADVEPEHHNMTAATVEDAACALGSTYRSRPVGADSHFAAFSFHPRKLLVTGEGGMITTPDGDLAGRLRRLRQHGMTASPFERHHSGRPVVEQYVETGFNYRLTDIQAAIGVVQATKLPAMVRRRRDLAERYHELLGGIPGLTMATDPSFGHTNYQTFWVLLPDDFPISADELLAILKRHGINARHGVTCAHQEPAFSDLEPVSLPVSERITRQSVLLPMFHALTEPDQERIADVICGTWTDPHSFRE